MLYINFISELLYKLLICRSPKYIIDRTVVYAFLPAMLTNPTLFCYAHWVGCPPHCGVLRMSVPVATHSHSIFSISIHYVFSVSHKFLEIPLLCDFSNFPPFARYLTIIHVQHPTCLLQG